MDSQFLLTLAYNDPVETIPLVQDYLVNRLRRKSRKRKKLQEYVKEYYSEVKRIDGLKKRDAESIDGMLKWLHEIS